MMDDVGFLFSSRNWKHEGKFDIWLLKIDSTLNLFT